MKFITIITILIVLLISVVLLYVFISFLHVDWNYWFLTLETAILITIVVLYSELEYEIVKLEKRIEELKNQVKKR